MTRAYHLQIGLTTLAILWLIGHAISFEAGEISSPMSMDDIRAIHESTSLNDEQIVAALTAELDRRITASRDQQTNEGGHRAGYEYATLIRLIAERSYPTTPKGRPQAIAAVIGSLSNYTNTETLRLFLNISIGCAGGEPNSAELLQTLDEKQFPREVLLLAIKVADERALIRSLPQLLSLTSNEWSYVDWPRGQSQGRRVYPLRDQATEALSKLGIAFQTTNEIECVSATRMLSKKRIEVDRGAVLSRLKTWLQSPDDAVADSAIEAVAHMQQNDVTGMLKSLDQIESMPLGRRNVIHKIVDGNENTSN